MSSYQKDLEQDEILNLSEEPEFQFAFSIEDYNDPQEMKDSKEYVKWLFRLWTKKDGVESSRELPTHKCTDKDYDKFYHVEKH